MKDFKKYPLGRIESPKDERDYSLRRFMLNKPSGGKKKEKNWDFPLEALDQMETSHCVGFSAANWGINSPINTPFANADGHRFYYECKEIEGEPNAENGAYLRSIGKVLKNNRHLEAYAFAHDMETIRWWLLNKGPLIVGTIWKEGMYTPDENNLIYATGATLGGHAYLLNEWREDGYIGIQNSWGPEWGINGKAYISKEDFADIFSYGGEALAAVEIPYIPSPAEVRKEKIKTFFKKLFAPLRRLFKCRETKDDENGERKLG